MKLRSVCLLAVLAFPARSVLADTWELQASGTGADLSGVAILSVNDMVAVGDKSGTAFVIRYTTDGGTNWNTPSTPGAPAGNNLNAIDFTGTTLVAVGKGGTITRSADGGANWTFPVSQTTKELQAVAFVTANIVVAAGLKNTNDYTVVRSTDGGATWAVATTPANQGVNLSAIAFNGTTAIAVGQKSGVNFKIIRSTDSGANWSAPASLPGGGQNLNAVTFISPTTLVAVGDNGTILTSTDAGDNWAAEVSPTAQNLNAVIASGTIVVAIGQLNGAEFTVVRSIDSGDNWSAAPTPAGVGENLRAIDASGARVAAVGDNGAILLSEDSGASWSAQNTGTLNNLFGVAIINPVIAVGQNGVILRSSASQTASGASGAGGGARVAVPFEGEGLLLVAIAGFGLYYLRPNCR